MDYIKLDKKAISSWRMGRILGFCIVLVICAALAVTLMNLDWAAGYRWIGTILLAAFALYKLIGIVVYPLIEYRQWGYRITEDKVEIRHGIFFITNTIVPIVRIQHITISQGPINRRLGLYEVEMSLASDSFEIPCLSKQVADEIAENLKAKLYVRLARQEQQHTDDPGEGAI